MQNTMTTPKEKLIFIVDDDPIYHQIIKKILRIYDFENVQTFLSGEECLAKIDQKPDIIFLDYEMNGIDGIEVLKEIRKTNEDINVIMVSGQDQINIAVDALKLGAVDYVIKDKSVFQNVSKLINNSFNAVI